MTETYGYDKTPTPPRDYDASKVPAEIKKRATWVKTKFTGEDVAEAYGQAMEITGIYSDEAKQIAQQTKVRQDNLETQFDAVQQESTDKDVVSSMEIVAARGGKATLGQRLDETTAQLADKVGGGKLATMADLGQDVKEALTGGSVAIIGDNTVIESNIVDKQVTPRKTSFIDVFDSVNRFNTDTVVSGYVAPSSGSITESETLVTTDFIEAKDLYLVASYTPSTGRAGMEMRFVAQYDANKKIIPYMDNDISVTQTKKVTLDPQTKYVRVSIRSDFQVLKPQLEFNNTGDFTEYYPYGNKIKLKETLIEDSLNNIKITPEKTTFMESVQTHNRYDSQTNVFGFISPNSGTVHSSEKIQTTDFIKVTDRYLNASKNVNGSLISATMRFVAQFDVDGKIIPFRDSDTTVNTVQYVQLHPLAAFVRVSFTESESKHPLQLEFTPDNVITSYVAYEPDAFKVLPEFLPSTTDETTSSPLTGKKVAWLGSSITQGYAWCELVNRFFNFNATNCGVGGTTVVYESISSMCTMERLLGTYSNVTDPITGEVTANGVAIPSDVEIIFWEGGTNDWARNWTLGGTKEITYDEFGNIELDTSTFFGACHQTLKNMTELFPNAVIIPVGTPFGKMENRTSFNNKYGLLNNQNLQSVEYGDALIEVCGLWGFKGVNMGREMGVHDNNVATLVPDGLHLTTPEVQSRASKVIINHLLSLGLF